MKRFLLLQVHPLEMDCLAGKRLAKILSDKDRSQRLPPTPSPRPFFFSRSKVSPLFLYGDVKVAFPFEHVPLKKKYLLAVSARVRNIWMCSVCSDAKWVSGNEELESIYMQRWNSQRVFRALSNLEKTCVISTPVSARLLEPRL